MVLGAIFTKFEVDAEWVLYFSLVFGLDKRLEMQYGLRMNTETNRRVGRPSKIVNNQRPCSRCGKYLDMENYYTVRKAGSLSEWSNRITTCKSCHNARVTDAQKLLKVSIQELEEEIETIKAENERRADRFERAMIWSLNDFYDNHREELWETYKTVLDNYDLLRVGDLPRGEKIEILEAYRNRNQQNR